MHCLVTGSSGFVAGHLIPKLLKKGHTVTAFVRRRSDGRISPILTEMKDYHPKELDIVKGDITDYQDVKDTIDNAMPDLVFHLASQSFVPDSVNSPHYTHEVNATGTLNILEGIRRADTNAKIVYTSSSEVYGFQWPNKLPLDEKSRPNPMSPYASAKLYGEYLCKNYYESYGVPAIISRAFNHEGPGRGHHFVTASIVRQMVAVKLNETDRIYIGNLDITRDWSHVSDIVNGYILLAERGYPGEVHVMGSGKQTSIAEFIDRTAMLLSVEDYKIFQDPSLMRKVDVPRLQANPKKMLDMGWKANNNLDDIIEQMAAYYMGMPTKGRKALEPEHQEGKEININKMIATYDLNRDMNKDC